MKRLLSTLLICFISLGTFAQERGQREGPEKHRPSMEKLEAMRTKYVLRKLDLSDDEKKSFTTMYDEYRKEMMKVVGKSFEEIHNRPELADIKKMTDAEAKAHVENQIKKQKSLIALKEKYFEKFSTIMPAKKVAMLFQAEIEFHKKLFRRMGERQRKREQKQD